MHNLYLPEVDARLRYHDLPGEKTPCVFLHGLGSASSADFPRVVRDPRLASHRAVLIDLMGFGFSDHPETFTHTLEAHAETVASVLDHVGLKQCHVVGHSMGGSIAIALADARPDLVSGLVVAECNLDPEDATFSQTIVDLAPTEEDYVAWGHAEIVDQAEDLAATDSIGGSFPGTMRAADPRAIYRCSQALVSCRLRETFFGLSTPRTYVFGERSLPHHHLSMLEAGGIPVGVIPKAGHTMVLETPEAFAAIVASTLSGDEIPPTYRLSDAPAHSFSA
ncbi:MAG: alpha/beta hydrolase [Chloroflexota bacterium]|nr:alpha/beta hydrolase [Chloroflexota bacterium]